MFAKKFFCAFFLVAAVMGCFAPLSVNAADNANDVPVWRVAWITRLDSSGRLHDNGNREPFRQAAYLFEEFIETYTNNAVDIQITHFEIFTEFGTPAGRLQWTEALERYNLDSFESRIIGMNNESTPFAGLAHSIWEGSVNFNFSRSVNSLVHTAIHEFLHMAGEMWFRDSLSFSVPWNIQTDDPLDRFALHNPQHFGFG